MIFAYHFEFGERVIQISEVSQKLEFYDVFYVRGYFPADNASNITGLREPKLKVFPEAVSVRFLCQLPRRLSL